MAFSWRALWKPVFSVWAVCELCVSVTRSSSQSFTRGKVVLVLYLLIKLNKLLIPQLSNLAKMPSSCMFVFKRMCRDFCGKTHCPTSGQNVNRAFETRFLLVKWTEWSESMGIPITKARRLQVGQIRSEGLITGSDWLQKRLSKSNGHKCKNSSSFKYSVMVHGRWLRKTKADKITFKFHSCYMLYIHNTFSRDLILISNTIYQYVLITHVQCYRKLAKL